MVAFGVDEELERRVQIAIRLADRADVVRRVVPELGYPVAKHLAVGPGGRRWAKWRVDGRELGDEAEKLLMLDFKA